MLILEVVGKVHGSAKGLVAELALRGELLSQFQIRLEERHGSCVDQDLELGVNGRQVCGQVWIIMVTSSLDHMCLEAGHGLKDSSTVGANWGLVHRVPALQPLTLSCIMGAQMLKELGSSVKAEIAELTFQGHGWARES